jgi:dephospho-CoA kinase
MQARMLKLHTGIQQTQTLIVTVWCAACTTLERVKKREKKAEEFKNLIFCCCFSIFAKAIL